MKKLLLLSILFMFSCTSEEPCEPTPIITTNDVTDFTDVSANVSGTITPPTCENTVTSQGFVYSKTTLPKTDDLVIEKTGANISTTLTNLEQNTTYYTRTFFENPTGVYYGNQVIFTTAVGNALISLSNIRNITVNSVEANVSISSSGGGNISNKGICYSTSEQPTIDGDKAEAGSGSDAVSVTIQGLTNYTVYYLRAFVVNESGANYSDQQSFTTRDGLGTLTTNSISQRTTTTAKSGGYITENGGASITVRGVCWSTTPSPTINDSKTEDGTGIGNYESSLTGLLPNTTYYVKAYSTNSVTTSYGGEISFTTRDGVGELTTNNVTERTTTTAKSGGDITENGGASITVRGVCWSTTPSPTINDSKTEDGTGIGDYTSNLTGLVPNTTYYVRAYSTNTTISSYGNEEVFHTKAEVGTVGSGSDIDGNVFGTIVMCDDKIWMSENLSVSKFRNGDNIPQITDGVEWMRADSPAWCYYDNDPTKGKLYNWYAVNDSRGLAPEGWSVASDSEWTQMISCLGGGTEAAKKIMATTRWEYNEGFATNESGFSTLPEGSRSWGGSFNGYNILGSWWTSTSENNCCATSMGMVGAQLAGGGQITSTKSNDRTPGFSVRCLNNNN